MLKLVAIALIMVAIVMLTQIYDTGASGVILIGAGEGLLAGMSCAIFIFGFSSTPVRTEARRLSMTPKPRPMDRPAAQVLGVRPGLCRLR